MIEPLPISRGKRSTAWLDPLMEDCGFGRFQVLLLLKGDAVNFTSGAFFLILGSVVDDLPAERWGMTKMEAGLLQSAVFVGITFGSLAGGIVSDRFGRRLCVLVAYVVALAVGACLALAPGYYHMAAACALFGLAYGISMPGFNALVVESAPVGRRGDVICLNSLCFYAGELYGAGCVWFVTASVVPLPGAPEGSLHWRACFFLGFMPLIPLLAYAFLCLDESPRYLAAQGRIRDAERTLAEIAVTNGVRPPEWWPAGDQVAEASEEATTETSTLGGALKLLSQWDVGGTVAGLMLLCVTCNFAFYGLMFALPQILQRGAGASSAAAAKIFAVTVFSLLGVALAAAVLRSQDIGHKISLAILFCVVALSGVIYAALASFGAHLVALGAACTLKLAISAVFVVLNIFVLEIFPTRLRSKGMAVCSMIGRLGAMAAPPVYALTMEHAGLPAYFHVIAGCSLAAAGTALLIPSETKGKSLGDTSGRNSFGTLPPTAGS